MKKNNNKGFTLIELLAVVVILLAISVMAITSISAAIERNKAQQDEKRQALIVSQGELYYDLHKNKFSGKNVACMPVGILDLTADDLKNSDGNPMGGYVRYYKKENGNVSFSYVTDESECNGNIIG